MTPLMGVGAAARPRVAARIARACRALTITAIALVAAMLFPSGAFAADKGINTDLTWGAGSQTQTADAMSDIGAGWTRITLSWNQVEPNQGHYDSSTLSEVDNAISLSRARGIKVLINVVETPSWETGSSDKRMPPKSTADFAQFVGDMATRYKGQADAWEIWNEENSQRFWPSGVNAGQYAQMLAASYPVIKAKDPGVPVVFGGLAHNDYGFVQAAYRAVPNLGSFFDVMATHPYAGSDLNQPPDLTVRNGDGSISSDSFNGYREVRQVMLSHGDDKPIWFTEFGWSTWSGGVSPQTQAAYTTQAMQCLGQDPYVQVAFLYNLRNNYWATDADDWDDQLGLMDTNWSHKPAYDAYKAYNPGSGGGCNYREPNGTATPAGTSAPASTAGSTQAGGGRTQTGKSRSTKTKVSLRLLKPLSASSRPKARRDAKSAGKRSGTSSRKKAARGLVVAGQVRGASGGKVVLVFQRRVWFFFHDKMRVQTSVYRDGTFAKTVFPIGGGWRVRAHYLGGIGAKRSNSPWIGFKV